MRAQRHAGFSLIEVLVAMAIAMVLMASLASLFGTTVKTRQQVDREGQKLENARYSLDMLSEDLRLAGYWGNYTPAGMWSSVSWQPVTPIEKVAGTCTVTALTTGWANVGTGTVKIPTPIMGFEAHSGSTTQTLPAAFRECLPNYLSGTDVLVIRRTKTSQATAGALTAANTYLQVSSCSSEVGSTDLQVGLGTATFGLRRLGCATTPVAPIWELVTRVYYVASENESGDGIPTLKMIDLSAGTATPVVVAQGVVDFHLEYGIDGSGAQWTAGQAVTAGEIRNTSCNWTYTAAGSTPFKTTCRFSANGAGTTGSTAAPSVDPRTATAGTTTSSDGAITWTYRGLVDGGADDYGVSIADPQRFLPDGSTSTGTALSSPWASGTGWHDVVSVRLWVVVRDLETSDSYTNSKDFIMGSATATAATINARSTNGEKYRYKSSGSAVKVVNSAGRREDLIP